MKTLKNFFQLIIFTGIVQVTHAQTIAFPEALGFGKNATGGRNGTVYHVTNLNDSGTGSFRDAVSASNRIIVFDVSGYIVLKTAVSCKSNLTIAGQTAPGEGIGFMGGEISFAKSSNIICRYIRIRPGSETASNEDDALSIYLAHNVIMDHCSFEYAPWNNIDGVSDDYQNYPVTDITFQSCLIANPIGQQFGAHCESVNSNWSWYYNIFANSHNRNPLSKINNVFVNNVLYNCSAGYTTHTSTNFKHDIVNNYFIFGPASTGTDNTWYQVDKNQSIYYSGNLKDNNLDGTLNGTSTTPYWYQGPGTILSSPWSTATTSVTAYNAATAYRYNTSLSGTFPYDETDRLILSQVQTLGKGTTGTAAGTTGPSGSLYTSQAQTNLSNNGYGTIQTGISPTDTDKDGMPDFWEKTTGSDSAKDDAMKLDTDGYALIEKYINWLGVIHAQTVTNTFVDIDLRTYTQGFKNVSPVYTVSTKVNGTVTLLSDGYTARFTPASNYSGMAAYDFTVKGSDNTSVRLTVSVAVVPGTTNCTGVITPTIISPATSFCTGGSLILTSSAGSSYKWYNGTTQVGTAATYTVTAAGSYTVEVTNAAGCKATSAATVISVNALPTATITSPATSFCAGGSLILTSSAGSSYKWYNATTQVGTASTYTATAAGSYTVEVTNAAGCKAASAATVISVNALPTATITSSSTSFCSGSSLILTSSAGSSYKWYNATTQVGTAVAYTATAAGSYTVEVTNAAGCKATSAATVISVNALPTATITSPATSFCTGGSLILTSSVGSSYKWYNATTQVGTAATYTAKAAGSYTVEVTNAAGCKATSAVIQITMLMETVWYADTDNDGKGDPSSTLNACTKPADYVSVAGDACPADAAKTEPGNCGCGKTENSCLDCAGVPNGTAILDNCNMCVGGTTGANACITTATLNGASTNITVIPQPFDNTTTIELQNMGMIQSLTIISASGTIVYQKESLHATAVTVGEQMAAGLYSVIIQSDQGTYVTKIVKK